MDSIKASNKRIARNSAFMTIRMIVVILISLYTTRVILNVLGVSDFGVYNVVAGFVIMFSFLNSTLSSAIQRFYNVELAKNGVEGARLVYCASFKIHLILALIIACVVEIAGLWYIPNKMVLPQGLLGTAMWLFQFSTLALVCNILYTPYMAAIMAHERLDFYASIEICNNFLKLVLALALPFIPGNKLLWYGVYNLAIAILILLSYYIYSKKKFQEIKLGVNVPKPLYKEILTFSGWGATGAFAYTLREQGINLILNFFFGTVVNAARGITNQINGALNSLNTNLFLASRPQIIQSYSKGELERAWKLTFALSKIMSLFFFIISLPVCIKIKYILHIWLGNEVPDYTDLFTLILIATTYMSCFLSPISTIIHATGKMKFYSILTNVSNLTTVPLAYLLIFSFNLPYFAYVALFITMVTNLLAALVSAKKYAGLNIKHYFRFVILPCFMVAIISLPIVIFPVFFLPESFWSFITEILYCLLVTCSLSYKIALNSEERLFVVKLFKKIRVKFKICNNI